MSGIQMMNWMGAGSSILHKGTGVVDGYDGYNVYGYVFDSTGEGTDGQYTNISGPNVVYFDYSSVSGYTRLWFDLDLTGNPSSIVVSVAGFSDTTFTGGGGAYSYLGNPFSLNGSGTENKAVSVSAA